MTETTEEATGGELNLGRVGALHKAHADFLKEQFNFDVTPEQVFAVYATRKGFRSSDAYRTDLVGAREAEKAEAEKAKEEAKAKRDEERAEKAKEREAEKAKKAEERAAAKAQRDAEREAKAKERAETKAAREAEAKSKAADKSSTAKKSPAKKGKPTTKEESEKASEAGF